MAADPKTLKIFQLEAILKQKETLINKLEAEIEQLKKSHPVKDTVQIRTPSEDIDDFPEAKPVKKKVKRVPPKWSCPDCGVECLAIHQRHHKCEAVDNG